MQAFFNLNSDPILPKPLETSNNTVGGHVPDRNSVAEPVHLNASMLELQTSEFEPQSIVSVEVETSAVGTS